MKGHADIVKLLIEVGQADVNTKNEVSHSNLYYKTYQFVKNNFYQKV